MVSPSSGSKPENWPLLSWVGHRSQGWPWWCCCSRSGGRLRCLSLPSHLPGLQYTGLFIISLFHILNTPVTHITWNLLGTAANISCHDQVVKVLVISKLQQNILTYCTLVQIHDLDLNLFSIFLHYSSFPHYSFSVSSHFFQKKYTKLLQDILEEIALVYRNLILV